MRVIQLCFQLRAPIDARDLAWDEEKNAAAFEREDKEIYQPLFALMERNLQKHAKLKFSLMLSGLWLELAEKYDKELIERLRKILRQERVELVAEPYYHSLPFFYDPAELTAQVKLEQDKFEALFGQKSRIFALPELVYNDAIGKWAEDAGFAGMLVGGSSQALDWRSPNHVYEAASCKYLRLLFENRRLSDLIMSGKDDILVEKTADGVKKTVMSYTKFQKRLELAGLRGNLLNIFVDAKVLRDRREEGVIGFFDELFTQWLKVKGNHFVGAAEACVVEIPKVTVSIPVAISRNEEVNDEMPAVMGDRSRVLPRFLQASQRRMMDELYKIERAVLASEDEKLIMEFRRLTAVDYILSELGAEPATWKKKLADLGQRVEAVKKAQALEISKSLTKRHERVAVQDGPIEGRPVQKTADSEEVLVHFGKPRGAGTTSRKLHVITEVSQNEVPVHRLTPKKVDEDESDRMGVWREITPDRTDAEEVKVEHKAPRRTLRKVIRKLVIE